MAGRDGPRPAVPRCVPQDHALLLRVTLKQRHTVRGHDILPRVPTLVLIHVPVVVRFQFHLFCRGVVLSHYHYCLVFAGREMARVRVNLARFRRERLPILKIRIISETLIQFGVLVLRRGTLPVLNSSIEIYNNAIGILAVADVVKVGGMARRDG